MGIKTHPLRAFAAAGLAAALSSAAWGLDVPVLAARAGSASVGFVVEGHVEPVRQATVAAQLGGNVLLRPVKAGDRVKAGQLIARIDERDAQAGVLRSDAAVAQAEAEARNARLNAERTRELRNQGFVSQAALDSAETALKAASSGVQAAQAARAQATLARGFGSVTAPFDGIVLATHLEAGDLATPGRPIATLYAPAPLRATVQVGLSRADAARTATRIEVELPGGQRVLPERKTELASADAVSQTIEWRLDLPAAATTGLLPGQVVQVHFIGSAAPATTASSLRVPAAAVLRRGELTAVYVAQGDVFALRAVRLGADHGSDGVEVLAGIKPGDTVAADALKAGLAGARPAR